jgi:hypothetical protein
VQSATADIYNKWCLNKYSIVIAIMIWVWSWYALINLYYLGDEACIYFLPRWFVYFPECLSITRPWSQSQPHMSPTVLGVQAIKAAECQPYCRWFCELIGGTSSIEARPRQTVTFLDGIWTTSTRIHLNKSCMHIPKTGNFTTQVYFGCHPFFQASPLNIIVK